MYSVIGEIGLPAWGSNAQSVNVGFQGLFQQKLVLAASLGKILTAVDDCGDLSSR